MRAGTKHSTASTARGRRDGGPMILNGSESARTSRAGRASGGGRCPGGDAANRGASARLEVRCALDSRERGACTERRCGSGGDGGRVRGGADGARMMAVERAMVMDTADQDDADQQRAEQRREPDGEAAMESQRIVHGLPEAEARGRAGDTQSMGARRRHVKRRRPGGDEREVGSDRRPVSRPSGSPGPSPRPPPHRHRARAFRARTRPSPARNGPHARPRRLGIPRRGSARGSRP